MNYAWSGLIILSFIFGAKNGCIDEVLSAGLGGAASSVEVLLSFAGIMCFWSGILRIAQESGASHFCERLLSPIIRRLFPGIARRDHITMNIVANLLGMGNAATPAGISAMEELDRENGFSAYPSHEMARFAVMNTASLQLIPTTVIGLLSAAGSSDPFRIVPLIWICSLSSLTVALTAEYLIFKGGGKK